LESIALDELIKLYEPFAMTCMTEEQFLLAQPR
jgi:hypothetical protein